jgi:hypothetical protein
MPNYNPFMQPMKVNYKVDSDVPHGCLRGGQKPTYRTWQKTQKHYPPMNMPVDPRPMQEQQSQNISREERLTMIKKKLQNLETKQPPIHNQTISIQTDPVPEDPVTIPQAPLPISSISIIKEPSLPRTAESENSQKKTALRNLEPRQYIKPSYTTIEH